MKFVFWLALKTLKSTGRNLGVMTWISLIGIVLGVGALVVSMAVMSGFESTLKNAIIDVAGDMQVFNQKNSESWEDLDQRLKKYSPQVIASSPFVLIEALAAGNGVISGAQIQGLHLEHYKKIIRLNNHLIAGKLDLNSDDEAKAHAFVGKVLAEKLNLKVGSDLRVVIPISSDFDPTQFRRRVGKLKVAAILDFGKYEYNERTIMTDIKVAQDLAEIGNRYQGVMVKLKNSDAAIALADKIPTELGYGFWARSWQDFNLPIFQAVGIERVTIFFVVFIIVIVAAFNVSSSLYINVVQRYPTISLLKTLGLTPKQVSLLFSFQGMIMGFIGTVGGYILGFIFCLGFIIIQKTWGVLPGSVYHLDSIQIDFRIIDNIAVIVATTFVTFVSALYPANKGARLSAIEGLKYE